MNHGHPAQAQDAADAPLSGEFPPLQRRISLTRAGQAFMLCYMVAVALVLPLGADAKMLAATILGFLVVAMLTAHVNLGAITLGAPEAHRAVALTPFPLQLRVRNRSRWRLARDLLLFHGIPERTDGIPDGYTPVLVPRQEGILETLHTVRERGRYESYEATLLSSFPLGLIQSRVTYRVPARFIVLPRLGSIRNVPAFTAARAGTRRIPQVSRRGDDDFHGLVEWRPGMDRKLIHWKLSARQSRTILKELEGEEKPDVHVLLSSLVPTWTALGDRHEGFEVAVSLAATLVEHFLRNGHSVRSSVVGHGTSTRTSHQADHRLHELIEPLADIEPEPVAEPPTASELLSQGGGAGELTLVVHATSESCEEAVPPVLQRERTVLFDAASMDLHTVYSRLRSRSTVVG